MSDRETQDRATAERIAADFMRDGASIPCGDAARVLTYGERIHLVLAGMRHASRRAEALTEQQVAEAWDATLGEHEGPLASWEKTQQKSRGKDFAHRIAALSSPVDLDAVRREAASKAFKAAWRDAVYCYSAESVTPTQLASRTVYVERACETYLAREYPAPAPDRVQLSWGTMAQDAQGQWCVWSWWPVERSTALLSVTVNPWEHVRCGEDAKAIEAFLAARVGGQP